MSDRCPVVPGERVRIVSGPYADHQEATVLRVTPIGGGSSRGPGWHLMCTSGQGKSRQPLPLLIDEVEPLPPETSHG